MLGKVSIAIEAQIAKFESDMGRAARIAEKEAAAMKRAMTGAMSAFAGGLAAAVGGALTAQAAIDALWGAVTRADKLDELSARLSISTEKLSGWAYAAQMSGTSIDDLAAAVPKLSKNMAAALDPKSSAAGVFDALGIKITDATGKLRQVQDVLPEIADKFKALDDSTLEASLAMELFGKSGAGLLEFLNRGGDGIKALEDRAAALGIVVSGDTAAAAAEFKDRLDDLHGVMGGIATQIASGLLPGLTETTVKFTEIAQEGDLARNAVVVLDSALKVAVATIDEYNNAVDRTSIAIGVMAQAAAGAWEVMKNLGPQGIVVDGSIAEGYRKVMDAYANGQSELDALIARQGAPDTSIVDRAMADSRRMWKAPPQAPGMDSRRLYGALGGGAQKKSAGKSDAEREADQLARAIEQANAQLDRQIALFDKAGEAAKMAYETAVGGLKNATQAQKDDLLEKAKWADWQEESKAIYGAIDEAARDQIDTMAQQHDAAAAYMDDLQFELDLTRMSNKEQQAAIAIRRAHADGIYGQDEAIRQYLADIQAASEQRRLLEDVQGSAEDMFASFIDGSKSASEAFEDFARDLQRIAARLLAQKAVEWLIGSMFGQNGMVTNWVWGSGGPGFASGGYTGPGGQFEPAGVVHKGEVVWSQQDVARAGGVGVVEAMRLGRRGYAAGGVVGGAAAMGGGIRDIVINTPPGSTARTEQRDAGDGSGARDLIVFIENTAKQAVASDIARGGMIAKAGQMAYGWQRQGVSRG